MTLLAVALPAAGNARPPADAGAARASALARTPAPAPAPAPASAADGPAVPVADGGLPAVAESAATAPVAPARLRIPSIGVDARVDAVALDPGTNQFDVPPSVAVVGWYRYGPGLEETAGSVVIAGHVDGARQGAGAFFRLRELAVDAPIEVAGADGRTRTFRAVARETYPKSAIPLERYFARDGTFRLTLITCGGPFDAKARSYRDNVVITAVLVS